MQYCEPQPRASKLIKLDEDFNEQYAKAWQQ
jgi:hypothetical protein